MTIEVVKIQMHDLKSIESPPKKKVNEDRLKRDNGEEHPHDRNPVFTGGLQGSIISGYGAPQKRWRQTHTGVDFLRPQ